jgi:hypothetical protein
MFDSPIALLPGTMGFTDRCKINTILLVWEKCLKVTLKNWQGKAFDFTPSRLDCTILRRMERRTLDCPGDVWGKVHKPGSDTSGSGTQPGDVCGQGSIFHSHRFHSHV